jgi:hypothetical protein
MIVTLEIKRAVSGQRSSNRGCFWPLETKVCQDHSPSVRFPELHLKCKEHDEQTLKLQRAEMNSNETVNSLLEMIGNKRKAEDNAFRDAEWIRPINECHIDYDWCHCSDPHPVRICIMRGMRGPPPGPRFVRCLFREECQSKILHIIHNISCSSIFLFFCRYDCWGTSTTMHRMRWCPRCYCMHQHSLRGIYIKKYIKFTLGRSFLPSTLPPNKVTK